jgi:hypothetical protein
VNLEDFVRVEHNAKWGDRYFALSLKATLAEKGSKLKRKQNS